MTAFDLARFGHLIGVMLMFAGLAGVFVCDLRGRRALTMDAARESAALVALFYDGLVVPGAVLLGAAGTWMIWAVHGWDGLFGQPWLLAMVALFALEFVEGNTITRLAFLKLNRLTREAGSVPGAALTQARESRLSVFTHFLDMPILLVIIGLGVFRPMEWAPILIALAGAAGVAAVLTVAVPRFVPWRTGEPGSQVRSRA
ncbi:DUF2269 family protein [Caenispirillum salinarum]|uniref:DUF2269 family protein n=1 Tax=Caenispirillum salinarum TaxID=859058 RepID=UPI0038507D50